ncbi:hypothetical protein FQA39_LY00967 [Lamprigera yunnana]|nr:hypothetical protein FQA39_LY00967 [Lamprigera yunnana]
MKVILVILALFNFVNCRANLPTPSIDEDLDDNGKCDCDDSSENKDSSDTSEETHHEYFYGIADDEHYTKLKINVVPSSHANSKIIFIKTPDYGKIEPEIIAPKSTVEDKTLLYVLIKKPQEDQSVSVPAGLAIKHHKPEVFFVKYAKKQEADEQIRDGINGASVGVNVPDLEDKTSFINIINSDADYSQNKLTESQSSFTAEVNNKESSTTATINESEESENSNVTKEETKLEITSNYSTVVKIHDD